jgi:hypothetical protein
MYSSDEITAAYLIDQQAVLYRRNAQGALVRKVNQVVTLRLDAGFQIVGRTRERPDRKDERIREGFRRRTPKGRATVRRTKLLCRLAQRADGRCTDCNQPNDRAPKWVCSRCAQKHAAYSKARNKGGQTP